VASFRFDLFSASLGELVRTLPARQLLLLWLATFSTFASLAFLVDIVRGGRVPIARLVLMGLALGGFAVGVTVTSLRRQWIAFASLIAAALVVNLALVRVFPLEPAAPPGRLAWDAFGTIAGITIGSSLFLQFMNVTATRYLRAQAELAVAHEIHRVLVPSIARSIGEYEFLGWSIASSEVGGDLVDLVDANGRWLGYVADVSGHGVGPGMVMGMFKSAVRIRALADGSVADVLGDIQKALMPLKHANMFVTVACVRGGTGPDVECAVAGHLPILRVRGGEVEEITTPQLAVGMFAHATFTSSRVECRSGDLLALLTDGLIEVFDTANRELGFEWAKTTLGELADRPLEEIADRLLAGARGHGVQLDDQTVLLIRRGTPAARA
jgi:serine phosphatase RsbU (regulator of sigma subunit)